MLFLGRSDRGVTHGDSKAKRRSISSLVGMLFLRGGVAAASAGGALVRYFSKKRIPEIRRINPKVPRQEATAISNGHYQIFKEHGPLSVSNTWNQAKEVGIDRLNSKTHMKIMLKWMAARKMVKLSCSHVGDAKKFHYSIVSEDPQASVTLPSPASDTSKSSGRDKKQTQNSPKKGKGTCHMPQ